jgi:hypothetical protein
VKVDCVKVLFDNHRQKKIFGGWRMNAFWSLFGLFNVAVVIGFLVLTVYLYYLMFKLAHRGIRALDLYIREKERGGNSM